MHANPNRGSIQGPHSSRKPTRLLTDAGPYKRYAVSYRGDGKRITGIMNIPDGKGPFPVVVLNHGYIDPDTYWSGQGMPREQDVLARRGFVVLHVDYRNHAGSSSDPDKTNAASPMQMGQNAMLAGLAAAFFL